MDSTQDLEGIQDFVQNDLKKMLLISNPAKEVPILKKGESVNFRRDYTCLLHN
jgi:hypothetical protein